MELKSNGHQFNVFDGYRKDQIFSFSYKQSQYKYHKKLNIFYREALRYKNNRKFGKSCNNESLTMEYDANLSPDFSFTYVDVKSCESLSFNLIKSIQKDFGQTQFIIQTQYINEEQELFQNRDFDYVDTLAGTVDKRLNFYKQQFDLICQKKLSNFLVNGFKVKKSHIIDDLASYIHFAQKDERVKLNNYQYSIEINKILAVFSVLNDDCLIDKNTEKVCLWDKPFYNIDGTKINEFLPSFIYGEHAESLEKIFEWNAHKQRGEQWNIEA